MSIAKAGAYAVGTNATQVLGGLLATAMLARLLGPEQKGIYDLYLASAMLLQFLLSFSLGSGVSYVVASQPIDIPRLMRALTIIGAMEAFAALGLVYLAGYVDLRRTIIPRELGKWGMLEVATTVFVIALSVFYRAALVGRLRFVSASYADVGKQVVGIVAIAGAFTLSRITQLPLLPVIIIANILTARKWPIHRLIANVA